MANFDNIELPTNDDENLENQIMVWLAARSSSADTKQKKRKSGLVMVSNPESHPNPVKTLKKNFDFWMPMKSQRRDAVRGAFRLGETQPIEFDDVVDCDQYVRSCANKSVILILFDHYAQDEKIVSDFKDLPQTIVIYCCIPQVHFNGWCERHTSENEFSILHKLPTIINDTPVQYLDTVGQHAFMYIFFTELVLKIPPAENVIETFIKFCDLTYKDDENYSDYKVQMQDFKTHYNANRALHWYTKSKNFVSRMVLKTCASLDFLALTKISFFLHDMYKQLKELHDKQLGTELKTGLRVFRGAVIPIEELKDLKNEGTLFVTRNIVSTTKNKMVAKMFSSKDEPDSEGESVFISIQIDHVELEEKPIAFVDKISVIPDEKELLLPMGIVLRVKSCRKIGNDDKYFWKIKMVRGTDEAKIEKDLKLFPNLAQAGAGCVFFGAEMFLAATNNGQQLGEFSQFIIHPINLPDIPVAEPLSNAGNGNDPSSVVNSNVGAETNTQIHDGHVVVEVPNEVEPGNHITSPTRMTVDMQQIVMRLATTTVVVVSILAAIVTAVGVNLGPKMNSTVTSNCLPVICSILTAVRNPSINYQVEQLNLTCSQTLINMSIIQTIQRTNNETHAQQYQTFWNQSTNMTYLETPSQLFYYWYSLPGMHIVEESFPHFIEAQYFYTPGVVRNTSFDTYEIWLESICGQIRYFNGTF